MRAREEEAGAATAEAAVVIPVLVVVAVSLAWMVMLGVAQVRVTDAARETARALARGDDPGTAVGLGRQVAPDGASVEVSGDGDTVSVRVTATVRPGGGLLGLPGFDAHATAVAAREQR